MLGFAICVFRRAGYSYGDNQPRVSLRCCKWCMRRFWSSAFGTFMTHMPQEQNWQFWDMPRGARRCHGLACAQQQRKGEPAPLTDHGGAQKDGQRSPTPPIGYYPPYPQNQYYNTRKLCPSIIRQNPCPSIWPRLYTVLAGPTGQVATVIWTGWPAIPTRLFHWVTSRMRMASHIN
jgi:hypothetical protein